LIDNEDELEEGVDVSGVILLCLCLNSWL
jgi:hypothetical protein